MEQEGGKTRQKPNRPGKSPGLVCASCPHGCILEEGQLGRCRSRRATNGVVAPEGYGRISSLALDPIEKKPISRYLPGTSVLSLGSYGCNMNCAFCQNASIAHAGADGVAWQFLQPSDIVERAVALRDRSRSDMAVRSECVGIAYTYNEPLVNWEFLRDTAALAHEAGLVNVVVSNGMATERVLDQIAGLIDAANIDLKCFTDEGYRFLGGNLESVKHTIERLAGLPSCHLELTTLVVPGISDDEAQIDAMARWIASLGASIPYHLTRFFPRHRMRAAQPTPLRTLYRLADVAAQHLDDVILGNV